MVIVTFQIHRFPAHFLYECIHALFHADHAPGMKEVYRNLFKVTTIVSFLNIYCIVGKNYAFSSYMFFQVLHVKRNKVPFI